MNNFWHKKCFLALYIFFLRYSILIIFYLDHFSFSMLFLSIAQYKLVAITSACSVCLYNLDEHQLQRRRRGGLEISRWVVRHENIGLSYFIETIHNLSAEFSWKQKQPNICGERDFLGIKANTLFYPQLVIWKMRECNIWCYYRWKHLQKKIENFLILEE